MRAVVYCRLLIKRCSLFFLPLNLLLIQSALNRMCWNKHRVTSRAKDSRGLEASAFIRLASLTATEGPGEASERTKTTGIDEASRHPALRPQHVSEVT